MYKLFRKLVFMLNPETAHKFVFYLLKNPLSRAIFKLLYGTKKFDLKVNRNQIIFKNIIGLAAGMDKDAEVIKGMSAIGFGFVEVGTVTPKGQLGNPKPRLKRLIKDNALLNRMGFNNYGVEEMKKQLESIKKQRDKLSQIGINIGKNKNTPLEEAHNDYIICFSELYDYADYFVINVSSPNTPNLRKLQEKKFLEKILKELQTINNRKGGKKFLFVKIAPDLTNSQIDEIIELVDKYKLTGIVATNTTISRDNLKHNSIKIAETFGDGGLSGFPLKDWSTEVIKYIRNKNKDIIIIGVGGIFSCKDMFEKIEAGADVIQIYTSFIYEGPNIVKKLKKCYYTKKVFKKD